MTHRPNFPLILLFLAALLVSACAPTPTPLSPGDQNAVASMVAATLNPATDTQPAPSTIPIVYYYFVALASNTYPAGSVVIQPDALILGPTLSEFARSADITTNISSALQAMLNDPRNAWKSSDLSITNITFEDGVARVDLVGGISAAGDAVLIAARYQVVLTVFAESAVQSATIKINGANIANLGISHSRQAQVEDYAYTRDEIETFLAENAYPAP